MITFLPKIIELAIEGGYYCDEWPAYGDNSHLEGIDLKNEIKAFNKPELLLDPSFFQALGKKLGWRAEAWSIAV